MSRPGSAAGADPGTRGARKSGNPRSSLRMTTCLATPRSAEVLVITAHPDDVDFGAAGTVATWTDAGIEVSYCIVTDGDAGGYDETVGRAEMASIQAR